jgi:carbamate kinase
VICAGGGGIPVVPAGDGGYRGVEAVIDKDLSAAFLATELHADALLLLTDVDAVYEDWGTPVSRPIRVTDPEHLLSLDAPAGSMGPKIDAVCRFIRTGGSLAAIGALDDAPALLRGEAGTVLRRSIDSPPRATEEVAP